MRIAITSTLMNFSKIWQTMIVMGMGMSRVISWGPKIQRFFKALLTMWTKMMFFLGIRSGWRISRR